MVFIYLIFNLYKRNRNLTQAKSFINNLNNNNRLVKFLFIEIST